MLRRFIFVILLILPSCLCSNVAPPLLFRPATSNNPFTPRDIPFEPHLSQIELSFVDEHTRYVQSPIGASLSFDPIYPTLLLDELAHHFKDVTCTDSSFNLNFTTKEARDAVYKSWQNHQNLLVIACQACNPRKETHEIRLVSSLELFDLGISMQTNPISFDKVSNKAQFSFGNNVYHERIKQNTANQPKPRYLERRSPEGFPIISRATMNSTTSERNSASIATSTHQILLTASTMRLTCEDCYTRGRVGISDGNLGINLATKTNLEGYINLAASDLFAHLGLKLDILPNFVKEAYRAPFLKLDLATFTIPVVEIKVDASFALDILMGVTMNQTASFSSGFQMELPSTSGIHLDLGNLARSHTVGFQDAIFRTLPFDMTFRPPDFEFHTALRPRVELSTDASALIASLEGDVGLEFDLPLVKVSIEEVKYVDKHCNPNTSYPIDHPLINVIPSAVLDASIFADLDADITVPFMGDADIQTGTTVMLVSTATSLPTACLDFDPAAGKLVKPTLAADKPERPIQTDTIPSPTPKITHVSHATRDEIYGSRSAVALVGLIVFGYVL